MTDDWLVKTCHDANLVCIDERICIINNSEVSVMVPPDNRVDVQLHTNYHTRYCVEKGIVKYVNFHLIVSSNTDLLTVFALRLLGRCIPNYA